VKLIDEIIINYNKIIEEILKYQKDIDLISSFVEWCDINQNKCYIAETNSYYRPTIDKTKTKSYFMAKELRHPLIEHIQTRELYISNDLTLGKEKNGVLLYGTNAVGKTSFIKSIGIAIIMAQAGLYVPASEFIFKPYKKIFTRILGNDNLFKGLSTFAVEMSELRTIILQADENSLVLGDELCSGTESGSAMSIFTSGLEWLYNLNATFLFATHFHEINNYEEIINLKDKLELMHMQVAYDREKNELIYDRKLKIGPGDNMYGLEVCKSLNLPDKFLERAHTIRIKYNEKEQNILEKSTSHFNKKKIKGLCEICNNQVSSEVHHLKHQNKANAKNFIDNHHKNHLANLINICEHCHHTIHRDKNKQHKIVKTTSGYKIKEIDI
jgi:DNA mismatch repair protein MutS